jgi:hypothetical protein
MEKTVTYEKYFDSNNKLHYYFNTETKQSVWELPEGSTVVDRTARKPEDSDDVLAYKAH